MSILSAALRKKLQYSVLQQNTFDYNFTFNSLTVIVLFQVPFFYLQWYLDTIQIK